MIVFIVAFGENVCFELKPMVFTWISNILSDTYLESFFFFFFNEFCFKEMPLLKRAVQ